MEMKVFIWPLEEFGEVQRFLLSRLNCNDSDVEISDQLNLFFNARVLLSWEVR